MNCVNQVTVKLKLPRFQNPTLEKENVLLTFMSKETTELEACWNNLNQMLAEKTITKGQESSKLGRGREL